MKHWLMTHKNHFIPNFGTIVVVALLLVTFQAAAASRVGVQAPAQGFTPGVISYQGTLADRAGMPLTGSLDMIFRLYAVPTGGPPLWEEAHLGGNAVPVTGGLFQVALGSMVPIPSSLWGNDALYLGIQVGTDAEMTPRQPLTGAPYAMQSGVALAAADCSIGSNALNLDHGTYCLSSHVTISLPGDWGNVQVPGVVLNFYLDQPSVVMVWADGLAKGLDNPSGEIGVNVSVDGVIQSSHIAIVPDYWFPLDGNRIIHLEAGNHQVTMTGYAYYAGDLLIHGIGGHRTCINYLVLGEQ